MPTVLFVGSFRPAARDGTVGGQMFACRSLVSSGLAERVRWQLLDSTQESLPPPGIGRRALNAGKRIVRLLGIVGTDPPEAALIFSSFSVPSLMEKALMARILSSRGIRVVLTLRTDVGGVKRGPALETLRRWVVESAEVTVCQSHGAAAALASPGDLLAGRTEVVPNWIASMPDRPGLEAGSATFPAPRFLFLGWLEEAKGVFELIEAFARVRGEIPSATLELCGDGGAAERLKAVVAQRGLEAAVEFRGWVGPEGKAEAFARCSALVLPSYSEGMPNAVLEAMAAGRAVIATTVGGIPDLVEDGLSGLLVEPRFAEPLAEAMIRVGSQPELARRMGKRGRELALERHSLERAWRRIAAALGVTVAAEPGSDAAGSRPRNAAAAPGPGARSKASSFEEGTA